MDVLGELLVEQVEIEIESQSVGAEILVREVSLVLVEMIVHLPELALRSRGFGRLGRELGVRMRGGDGEVAEDESELLSHAPLDVLDDRVRLPAVGALVIAILNEVTGASTEPWT